MKKPDYKKAMQKKNRQASNIIPIKSNVPDKPTDPPSPPPPAQPKKAMADPSTLPDGDYPFQVIGGNMIKNGNKGIIILRFRFIHPDLTGINLDLPIITIQLGNIITPGPGPVPKNLIKKE